MNNFILDTKMNKRDLNFNCLQVNNAIMYLADELGKYLFGKGEDDFQIEWIDWEDDCLHYNFTINDEYFNIDEAYTILWYKIPKEMVFEYKEMQADPNKEKINIKNFYTKKKRVKEN